MKKVLLAALVAGSTISSAFAADLPRRAAPVIPPPPPVLTWSGFYAGVNVGASWADRGNVNHLAFPGACNPAFPGCVVVPNYSVTAATASTFGVQLGTNTRLIGGGQIGWNYQFTGWPVVAGIEADIQGLTRDRRGASFFASPVPNPNFPGFPDAYAATVTRNLDYIGTVRGRLGYLINPAFLFYATGGLAYGGVRSSTAEAIGLLTCAGAGNPCTGVSFNSISKTRIGVTGGGGFEWMFLPNWSVKGEYLYYDLGRVTYGTALNQFCNGAGCAVNGGLFASTIGSTSIRYKGHIVRAGLNYHFNWGSPLAPVVARY
ncbi:MAG TPA: outer membrane beta-barrel protein [Chthoniobacterales bacterium]